MTSLTALPRRLRLPAKWPVEPATAAVAIAWVVLLGHVLSYVIRFGIRAPYQDEWFFTGVLADPDLNWNWVWALHSEHRYPLGKVLYWCLTTSTGDFRAGAFITAILNAAVAAGMVGLARHLRGRTILADVLFPALLLNWGQFENYLFGYQIVFSMTVAAMAVVLGAAATCSRERAFRNGLAAGLALLVIVQGGGYGLAAVGPVGLWIAGVALGLWRDSRRRAMMVAMPVLLSFAYVGIVLSQFEPASGASAAKGTLGRVVVFLQALGCGLGDGAATLGYPVPWVGALVLVAYLAVFGLLLRVFVTNPDERGRALGLAVVPAWSLLSAAAIAMARDGGYSPRYAGPGALGLCGLLIAAIVYGPSLRGRLLPLTAVVLALGIVVVNIPTARHVGRERREHFREFQRDMAAGMPVSYLASKYSDSFFFPQFSLAPHLPPLAQAGFEPFQTLRGDGEARLLPLETRPAMTLPAAGPEAFANRASLPRVVLWSGEPREVRGIRVRFTLAEPLPLLTLVVRDDAGQIAAVYRRPPAGEHEATFWIGRRVSKLTLEPASLAPAIPVQSVVLEVPPE